MLYLKRGEGRPSPLSTIQKGEKMGKKAKQNEAGYDNNGNKVEAKTSVLLCDFVLAVVVLAGILLILLADCYGWFTFLEKPLNAAGQFLKRNWMNIWIGLISVALLLCYLSLEIGGAVFAKKRRREIEANVVGSVPISRKDFLRDWDSAPSRRGENACLDGTSFGYKYVFCSGVYVIAEVDELNCCLDAVFIGSSSVGACCSRAYAHLSCKAAASVSVSEAVHAGRELYVVFVPCQAEYVNEVKGTVKTYLERASELIGLENR